MNTSASNADLVHQISREMATTHAPVVAFIIITTVVGFIGNLMVFYFYGFKSRKSINTLFITNLAAYDVLSCLISLPAELMDIILYYEYNNIAACKLLTFAAFVLTVGSILTLLDIAVDRFQNICRPLSTQISEKKAKLLCFIIPILSVFLSSPILFIYQLNDVHVPNEHGLDLTGHDCASSSEEKYKGYIWAYSGLQLLVIVVSSVVLITMYSIIGRNLFTHIKNIRKRSNLRNTETFSIETSDSEIPSTLATTDIRNSVGNILDSNSGNVRETTNETTYTFNEKSDRERPPANGNGHLVATSKRNRLKVAETNLDQLKRETLASSCNTLGSPAVKKRTKRSGLKREHIKLTIVMIIVTGVFICSFIPYLGLTIWKITQSEHEAEVLKGDKLVAYKFGKKSFLLNSALNPWIYGIFNSQFRNFFFIKPFRKVCRR